MMKKYLAIAAMASAVAVCSVNAELLAPEAIASDVSAKVDQARAQQLATELVTMLRAQGLTEQDIFELIQTVHNLNKQNLTDKEIVSVLQNAVASKTFVKKSNTGLYLTIAAIVVVTAVLGAAVTWYLMNNKLSKYKAVCCSSGSCSSNCGRPCWNRTRQTYQESNRTKGCPRRI